MVLLPLLILLRKRNTKQPQHIPIGGLDITTRLDDGLTLLDETADFVAGHVHAVEVEEAVEALDVFDTEFDLAVGEVF